MGRYKTCVFSLAIAVICAGIAYAQLPSRIEIHAVKSRTLTGAELHIGYNPDSTAAVRLAVTGFFKQALLN